MSCHARRKGFLNVSRRRKSGSRRRRRSGSNPQYPPTAHQPSPSQSNRAKVLAKASHHAVRGAPEATTTAATHVTPTTTSTPTPTTTTTTAGGSVSFSTFTNNIMTAFPRLRENISRAASSSSTNAAPPQPKFETQNPLRREDRIPSLSLETNLGPRYGSGSGGGDGDGSLPEYLAAPGVRGYVVGADQVRWQ